MPTIGAPNVGASLGSPAGLRINEWLAFAWTQFGDDFVEIYNPDSLPVDISGFFLTDKPLGWIDRHAIAPLSFIGARGFTAFHADGNTDAGADHLAFSLDSEQGQIALADPTGAILDSVIYGPQMSDTSLGLTPDGGSTLAYFQTPTPGAPNPAAGAVGGTISIPVLAMDATWRYDQSGADLGTSWRETAFVDTGWPQGRGVLGYDNGNNTLVQSVTNTVLALLGTNGSSIVTHYFRTSFDFTNSGFVTGITFSNLIDDGAVFYLNGVEIYRENMPSGTITAGTYASSGTESTSFSVVTRPAPSIVTGRNVLAVELHQNSSVPSDANMGAAVFVQISTNPPTPTSVVINEVLANNSSVVEMLFGTNSITPDWVELYNLSTGPVDLSGASLTDTTVNPRRWVFPTGSTIPGSGYLRIRCDADLPASTIAEPVMNAPFGLSASGGGVFLFDSPARGGALLSAITYGIQATDYSIGRIPNGGNTWNLTRPTPSSANIVSPLGNAALVKINEWMADPASGDDWFELYNPNAQPVALGNYYLTDDLNNRTKSRIPPLSFIGVTTNSYLQIRADSNTGAGADHVNFALGRGGESLGFSTPAGVLIDGLTFAAQQTGVSEGRFPNGSAGIVRFPGTVSPGEPNYLPLTNVVISEVLSHSDPPWEDAIELQNLTAAPINIGGWFLSDSKDNFQKYRIPTGYLVFYEYQFNNTNEPSTSPFALSSANGDQVYLSAATNGLLTGYRTSVDFGPALTGVSFGRYQTSVETEFVSMRQPTFGINDFGTVEQLRASTNGAPNSLPAVGPVVISEIMYHPQPIDTNDNVLEEFIELHNPGTEAVPLYHPVYPNLTWRIRDGVDFDFPPNITIPAGGYVLVVSFDPAVNTAALQAFRARYPGLHPDAIVLGPYIGKLDNGSDDIELKQPDTPEGNDVPYVLVEHVRYRDVAPWPLGADGSTNSIQRRVMMAYGNDPTNWVAAVPTPSPAGGVQTDNDGDGMPNAWETQYGLNPNSSADASLDLDGDGLTNLQEYRAGTDPTQAGSTLRLQATYAGAGSVQLSFQAVAGRTYTIEYKDSLSTGTWQIFANVPAGSAGVRQMTVPIQGLRFYRLKTP
jgi:hypothetical protein